MYIDTNRFCYWDCQSVPDAIVINTNMLITFLLFLFIIKIFYQSRKVLRPGVSKIYYLLITWAIINFFKDLYGIFIYFYMYNSSGLDETTNEDYQNLITKNSAIYEVIQTIPALLIQSLLFIIPYKMIGNILGILRTYDNISTKQVKLYKFLRFYRFFRFSVLVPLVIILIVGLLPSFDLKARVLQNLTIIKTSMLLIDSIVCIFLTYFCFKFLQNTYQNLRLADEDQINIVKRESILLGVVCFFRFAINLLFYLINPIILKPKSEWTCIQKEQMKGDYFFLSLYLILGTYLMHFLPVIFISNMYKVK